MDSDTKNNQNEKMEVDTLIIGSGVVGAAIAQKILDEFPKASILMLEAGPKVKMKDFTLFHNYLITREVPYKFCEDLIYPEQDKPGENNSIGSTLIPLHGSRLMIYGGSTVHWGGWSFRMKPEDFKLNSNLNNGQISATVLTSKTILSGSNVSTSTEVETGIGSINVIDWPYDYDTLRPYYSEAEEYIGVSGDSDDNMLGCNEKYPFRTFPYTLEDSLAIDAMNKLNISYGHMPIARRGLSGSESRHAPCQTTGTCKYCPFGARYVAANYLDDIKEYGNYPNFEILTDVVVENISMSSRGQAEGVTYVNKDLGGSKQVNAKRIIVAAGAIESAKLLQRSTSNYWIKGIGNDNDLVGRHFITHPYIRFGADLPSNPKRLQTEMDFPTLVSRHYDSKLEQAKGKYILVNPAGNVNVDLAKAMKEGKSPEQVQKMLEGKTKIEIHALVEIFSQHRNRVTNADDKNHFGLPETIVDFSKGPNIDQRIDEMQREVNKIFTAMGAKDPRKPIVSWRADHAACTTRMSVSAVTGVVDKNLKVFEVDNLYVCSNGSFSSLGAVNPTLTLTAIALKLGDHLIGKIYAAQDVAESHEA